MKQDWTCFSVSTVSGYTKLTFTDLAAVELRSNWHWNEVVLVVVIMAVVVIIVAVVVAVVIAVGIRRLLGRNAAVLLLGF
jgi:ABC-type spermidine/putrescine transport system permease subunit II